MRNGLDDGVKGLACVCLTLSSDGNDRVNEFLPVYSLSIMAPADAGRTGTLQYFGRDGQSDAADDAKTHLV